MKNFMDKLTVFIEEKLNPAFGAFAELPFVSAIAKAFNDLMPLMMIGSFAALFTAFTPEWYQNFITNTGIKDALTVVNNLTINITALWLACALGYEYAIKLGMKKYAFVNVFVSGFSFLMAVRYATIEGTKYIAFTDLGSRGLFTAMVTSVLATRVYKLCVDKKIYIKMPQGVPVYIQNSFAGIVPGAFMAVIMSLLQSGVQMLGYDNFTSVIYSIIATPLNALTSSTPLMVILMTLPTLFWFFGIHGANATGAIINPIMMTLAMENVSAYAAGEPIPNVIAHGIMMICGIYAVPWAILCLTSKQERFKSFGKMSIVPSLFGVSEPNNFGIPLVLNSYLFIPQILMTVVNLVLTISFISIGILPRTHAMYTWGLPIFVSGFIQIGFIGILWQLVLLVVDIMIALPFWRAYEKSCLEEAQEEE